MSKIDEARDILEQLGLPPAQRNDISCLTLLALTGLSEDDPWSQASKPSRTMGRKMGIQITARVFTTVPVSFDP